MKTTITTVEYFRSTVEEINTDKPKPESEKKYAPKARRGTPRADSIDWEVDEPLLMKLMGGEVDKYRDAFLHSNMNLRKYLKRSEMIYGPVRLAAATYIVAQFMELDQDPTHSFQFKNIKNFTTIESFTSNLKQRIEKLALYAEFELLPLEPKIEALRIVHHHALDGTLARFGFSRMTQAEVDQMKKNLEALA